MGTRRLHLCLLLATVLLALPAWHGISSLGMSVTAMAARPYAPATDGENVEFVGHIGGSTYAVAVRGDYAYIGEGPRLTILDVSDPASPIVVGKTAPLPDVVWDVYMAGGYAYVADDWTGLRVIYVSDPAHSWQGRWRQMRKALDANEMTSGDRRACLELGPEERGEIGGVGTFCCRVTPD